MYDSFVQKSLFNIVKELDFERKTLKIENLSLQISFKKTNMTNRCKELLENDIQKA